MDHIERIKIHLESKLFVLTQNTTQSLATLNVEIDQIKGNDFDVMGYTRPEREGDPDAFSMVLKIPMSRFSYLGFIPGDV